MRNQIVNENAIPTSAVKRDHLISVKDDSISKCLFPSNIPIPNLVPVEVYGDGNCFHRSVAKSVFGTESRHVECRVRCVFELVKNFSKYLNQETYTCMSSHPVNLQYILETSFSNETRVSNDMSKSLQNDILTAVENGQYSSLIHFYASANAFNRPIVTIFPEIHNVAIFNQMHNQTITPLPSSSLIRGHPIYIMWTHTTNTDPNNWTPNHFVSCHETELPDSYADTPQSDEPDIKKQKLSDNMPSQSSKSPPVDENLPSYSNVDEQHIDLPVDSDDPSYLTFDFGKIVSGKIKLSSLSNSEKVEHAEKRQDPNIVKHLPFRSVNKRKKEKKLYFQASWLESNKWLTCSRLL